MTFQLGRDGVRDFDFLHALVGGFVDGIGEFLGDDEKAGRPVRVRFRWSDITPSAARWEQAFSVDDGAAWEMNWIMTFARRQPNGD